MHRLLLVFLLVAIVAGSWLNNGPAQPSSPHSVILAVKQPFDAAATCNSLLMDIADPDSANYGQHKTLAEVNRLLLDRPRVKRVESWLRSAGYTFSTIGDYVEVKGSITELETLLDTKFHSYTHSEMQGTFFAAEAHSVPSEIREDVELVLHVRLPTIRPDITSFYTPTPEAAANGITTPSVLWQTYGIDNRTVRRASQALFEGLGQNFSPKDLSTFQTKFSLPQTKVAQVTGSNNGDACSSNPNVCGEANLDVQYMLAIAPAPDTRYWVIPPNAVDPFYNWIIALSQTSKPAQVHSVSYGSLAPEDPVNDMTRFNTEACKLGLRGVTIVVASGDDGVANFPARNSASKCGFVPSFPATSPYVVAVGATMGPESGKKEIACTSDAGGGITTGGGFSIRFGRPSYQANAVAGYLQRAPNLPNKSHFASNGRGYPDVAVSGYYYAIVDGGKVSGASGTSASAPVFAGMLTLINEARLASGKRTVGFVNPALYRAPSSTWNDITQGRNNCAAGQAGKQVCCSEGFTATTGWDPLTGLGSPKFQSLRAFLKNL